MPYVVPTVTNFRERFPEFASSEDPLIARVLADASLFIDTTWNENDFQPAILYLAAHILTLALEEYAASAAGTGSTASRTYLRQVRFGERAVSWAVDRPMRPGADAATSDGQLARTTYGVFYLMLLWRNITPVLVV